MQYYRIPYEQLKNFCAGVFQGYGFSAEQSAQITDVLLAADLSGIESHGIQRLIRYHKEITGGLVKLDAKPEIVRETPLSAVIEGNDAMGTVPAPLCTPEGGMCGSPPHLIEMPTGEVVTVYGYRNQPYGQRARVSFDHGDTWSREIVLRDDGPTGDLGYPASVIVGDDLLTVYYQKRDKDAPCGIYATLWNYHEFL